MAGYCTSVRPYFHEPQASENTATHSCNIQPYCLLTHQIIDLLHTTLILQHLQHRQLLRMRSTKVIATCIFNKPLAAGLFPTLDGTSLRTDPSISGRKYRKSVYNAVFIHNKSINVVSAAATSAFQLKHMPRLLGSKCPVGYQIRTIEYGKILVMLLYGKYYWRVYEVYNKYHYTLFRIF